MLRMAVKRQKNEKSHEDNENELGKTAKQYKIVRTRARPLQREEKVLEKLVLGAEDELLESLEKKSVEKVI